MESVQNKFQERAYCKSEGIFRRPEPCTPRECLLPGVVVVLAVALRTFSTPNESPRRRRSHRSAEKEPAVQLLFCASQKGGKGGRRGYQKEDEEGAICIPSPASASFRLYPPWPISREEEERGEGGRGRRNGRRVERWGRLPPLCG